MCGLALQMYCRNKYIVVTSTCTVQDQNLLHVRHVVYILVAQLFYSLYFHNCAVCVAGRKTMWCQPPPPTLLLLLRARGTGARCISHAVNRRRALDEVDRQLNITMPELEHLLLNFNAQCLSSSTM